MQRRDSLVQVLQHHRYPHEGQHHGTHSGELLTIEFDISHLEMLSGIKTGQSPQSLTPVLQGLLLCSLLTSEHKIDIVARSQGPDNLPPAP